MENKPLIVGVATRTGQDRTEHDGGSTMRALGEAGHVYRITIFDLLSGLLGGLICFKSAPCAIWPRQAGTKIWSSAAGKQRSTCSHIAVRDNELHVAALRAFCPTEDLFQRWVRSIPLPSGSDARKHTRGVISK